MHWTSEIDIGLTGKQTFFMIKIDLILSKCPKPFCLNPEKL